MDNRTHADNLLRVEGRLMDLAPRSGDDEALDRVLGRIRAHATAHPLRSGRPWWRAGWSGPMVVAVPLAAAAALLAAITLGHPQQARHVSPAGSPRPTAVPPVPASPSPSPAVVDQLSQVRMTDVRRGWGLELISTGPDSEYRVVTTTDGGRHWQRTSSQPPFRSMSSALDAVEMAAPDSSTVWLAVAQRPALSTGAPGPSPSPLAPARVYRSSDGGRTWQQSTPIVEDGDLESLDFVDRRTGWLSYRHVIDDPSTDLWRTVDGGATWSHLPAAPGGSVSFRDASTWFAATGYGQSGQQRLQVTHDAGRTWRPVTLPALPGYSSSRLFGSYGPNAASLSAPVFTSHADGTMIREVGATTGANCLQYAALYRTADGGVTWTARELPATPWAGTVGAFYPHLWMLGCGPNGDNSVHIPWASDDGGTTWRRLGTDPGFIPEGVQFFDRHNGLALGPTVGAADRWRNDVWTTSDGGATWTEVNAVLPGP